MSATEFLESTNFVPLPYRQVSVHDYDGEMTSGAIESYLAGKDSYRATRFIVVAQQDQRAVAAVERTGEDSLFSPIVSATVLAEPSRCSFARDPEIDTGNGSALAQKARELGIDKDDTLVVEGRDAHVNFIHKPRPHQLHVVDVVPPEPAKLGWMVEQVLAYADLPPTTMTLETIDLRDLAASAPESEAYLIPCRASGLEMDKPTFFLDQRPDRQPWTLLGCERSRQIHRHFFGDEPPCVEMCPRRRIEAGADLTILKCCLLESSVEVRDRQAVVPWGGSLADVENAVRQLIANDQ